MVIVGSERVGASPLEDAVIVDPGHYVVTAELVGHEATPVAIEIDVAAGATQDVVIDLHAATTVPAGTKPIWPYFVGGGIAVAGAAVAVGGFVGAAGEASDASNLAKSSTCHPASKMCLTQGQSFDDKRGTLSTVGVVGASIGGAALVATIVYAVIPARSTKPDHAWLVVPSFSNEQAGAVLLGSF